MTNGESFVTIKNLEKALPLDKEELGPCFLLQILHHFDKIRGVDADSLYSPFAFLYLIHSQP